MRTVDEMLQDFVASGARVAWKDGKPALVGSVPDSLILEIRERRAEFLSAWDEHEACVRASRGYGVAPDIADGQGLRRTAPGWPWPEYRRMEKWARRQPDQVVAWVLRRAEGYQSKRPDWTERDRLQAALADLWEWQLGTTTSRPGQVLLFLDQTTEAVP